MRSALVGFIPERQKQSLRRLRAVPHRRNLDRLAHIYGTDKATADHGYTEMYQRHLPRRSQARRLLEIGVGGTTSTYGYETTAGGASLRMWQDYYPHARIVGVDIHRKVVRGPRILVEQGSQDDREFLRGVTDRHGPFDVIIDDGSHIGRHQHATFTCMFEALRSGGVYVIEDLATAYREDHEGGMPGTPGTAVALLQAAVDHVLRQHWDSTGTAPAVQEMHIYDEMAFLVKE